MCFLPKSQVHFQVPQEGKQSRAASNPGDVHTSLVSMHPLSSSDDYPRSSSHLHASSRAPSSSLPMDLIARTASTRVNKLSLYEYCHVPSFIMDTKDTSVSH